MRIVFDDPHDFPRGSFSLRMERRGGGWNRDGVRCMSAKCRWRVTETNSGTALVRVCLIQRSPIDDTPFAGFGFKIGRNLVTEMFAGSERGREALKAALMESEEMRRRGLTVVAVDSMEAADIPHRMVDEPEEGADD